MNDFWKENDLDGYQGDLRALGPVIFIKIENYYLNMCNVKFLWS